MSRLLYVKPIEHFICLCTYSIQLLLFYFCVFFFICTIGVAFAFTFHVCLGTVIYSYHNLANVQ